MIRETQLVQAIEDFEVLALVVFRCRKEDIDSSMPDRRTRGGCE